MGGFRRFIQIVVTLIFILALVAAISLFYPIPYLSAFAISYLVGNWTLRLVVAVILGLLLVYCVFLFFRALFVASKHRRMVMDASRGDMNVSKQAIEATALSAVKHVGNIYYPDAKVTIYDKPEDTEIDIQVSVGEMDNVPMLGQLIQERVQAAVQRTLHLDVHRIDVKINQVSPAESRQAKHLTRPAQPRVR
ncbi:alkaline shock response membrane anchor protein AmaP [Aerococcus sanguinicola]|uniref:alkaline shock response membrane anchor protein AmaP n=1 Tax=unclassified Aerococcus TaxID=2618060 RepID=UPI0008A3506E|nr:MULTISPECIES: alkaline shock response membrane anchor protein AmaP [unclassified Aerococcus]KAB0646604.1 alkaline shock response membrane anchor protein AmaP [Aerococcus sanguinicola]MDK6233979.1 alkaline shock response membrane anchor protein AmaP [Aerococcus sp. UMB10185]MDK6805934.1 alkaline shock response membrane anchor protein AmaP [Aerococcus sp. UMB7834]MDK6856677.1 alkaline shock response membrane anchor protein AmaP [Aerococcus sp. UMB7533]MDK8502725.1 alkaline shock response memb